MKELELTLKLRNNLLKSKREELGLSARKLAEQLGMGYGLYLAIEGMNWNPTNSGGHGSSVDANGWKPSAWKIAKFHGVHPSELWPDAVLAVKSPKVVAEVDADRIGVFKAFNEMRGTPQLPENALASMETVQVLNRCLDALPPRERDVIVARFGLDGETKSLDEAGEIAGGVSRERARQLEARALRKLRDMKELESCK